MFRIFLSLLFLTLFTSQALAIPSRNLTVFAEQNMISALIKISRLYSQKNHVIVSVNFNSSADLINDVDSGEPADIFISAHVGWIESLKQKGLTDVYNTGHIARDRLVLITTKSNTKVPEKLLQKKLSVEEALQILNQQKSVLITDPESNSSGKYSNDFVRSLNFSDLQIFNRLNEDNSSALKLMSSNAESYAILLESQIKNKSDLQILASQKDAAILYQALVIAGDNMETAREFLKFLKSDVAKNILRDNGLTVD